MSKVRVFGFIMFVSGIGLHFSYQSDAPDLIKGILIGAGFVLLLTGKKHQAI